LRPGHPAEAMSGVSCSVKCDTCAVLVCPWCVSSVFCQCSSHRSPPGPQLCYTALAAVHARCAGDAAPHLGFSASRDTPPCAQLPTLGHLSDPRGHVGKGPLSEVGFISSCFPAASPSRARPRGALIADSISKLLRRTYPYSLPSPVSLPVSSPVSLLYPAAAPQQLFSRARLWFLI
jgi:hypothetical protein